MKLLGISLYTLDVKGDQILEVNDLVGSAIKPLDKVHGGDFVFKVVAPKLWESLGQNRDMMYIRPEKDFDEYLDAVLAEKPADWNGIILSGFSKDGTGYNAARKHRERACTVVNASRRNLILYANKAFLGDVADREGLESVAKSRHYKADGDEHHIEFLAQQIESDFPGVGHVVIKPLSSMQGKGIVVVEVEKIREELQYLLRDLPNGASKNRYDDHGFVEKFWADKDQCPDIFQVQEFIDSEHTIHKGKEWDGTRRYVCATIIEEDEGGGLHVITKVYGGFVKLPRKPVLSGGDHDQNSSISFSYAHGLREWFTRFAHCTTSGSGDTVILSDEQVEQDTVQIAEDMTALFEHLHTMNPEEYVRTLGNSDNPAHRQLSKKFAEWLQVPNSSLSLGA